MLERDTALMPARRPVWPVAGASGKASTSAALMCPCVTCLACPRTALEGAATSGSSVFWHYPHYSNQAGPPYGAVRHGNFKLIEWYEDMSVELYNLSKDPSEKHDLAQSEKSATDSLRAELHTWRKAAHAEMPKPNPDYKPAATSNR